VFETSVQVHQRLRHPVIDIDGSETGAAFRRIARRLLGESIEIPTFAEKPGLLSRVMTTLGFARS